MATDIHNQDQTQLRSFAAHVLVDPSRAGPVWFGIACQGDLTDFNTSFLLLVNATGDWQITKLDGGNATVLAQGSGGTPRSVDTLDMACAGPIPGMGDNSIRLVIALNHTILGSADQPDMLACCSVEPFALTQGAGGSVAFAGLKLYTATASG